MALNVERFPRLASYLGLLKRGLDAHPTASTKGSIARAAILDRPVLRPDAALPPELAVLFERPPLPSTWIRSVHTQALFLAIADDHAMSDDQFGDWTYCLQKRLFQSVVYRAVAVVARPRMLLAGTRMRWSSFHRGTELEVAPRSERDAATVVLHFPAWLYARTNLLGFARGFQAVVELSSALRVQVQLGQCTQTRATFEVRWQERDAH